MPVVETRLCVALFALAVGCFAPPAQAQSIAQDCDITTVQGQTNVEPDWEHAHPTAVLQRLAPLAIAGQWDDVFAAYRLEVAAETRLAPDIRARVLGQLDALRADLVAVSRTETREEVLAAAQGFNRQRFRMDSFVPLDADEEVFTLFPGTPDEVEIGAAMNDAERRALCYAAIATDLLLTRYGETDRAIAVRALDRMVAQWDQFNETSYSMYPWELWANSLGQARQSLTPPRRQFVVLHPSVSFGVTGSTLDELQRQDLAGLEVVGVLVYNKARSWYGGASALVTLPTQGGPGVGALVHVSPTLRGGYVVDVADGSAGGFVVSLDLYKALLGVPDRLRLLRARVEAVRDAER